MRGRRVRLHLGRAWLGGGSRQGGGVSELDEATVSVDQKVGQGGVRGRHPMQLPAVLREGAGSDLG